MRHKITSLIEDTVDEVCRRRLKRVVLLASPTTIETKLYELALLSHGVELTAPSEDLQTTIDGLIHRAIANESAKTLKPELMRAINSISNNDAVLLGCTELSLIFGEKTSKNIIDPMNLIVSRLMQNNH